VKAVVVTADDAGVDARELAAWVGETLARHKVRRSGGTRRPMPRNAPARC